jgi:inner membrane transporter RhtA
MSQPNPTASTGLAVGLLIAAVISFQIGATVASGMFAVVGAPGASALRLFFGTVMLALALRPWRARPTRAAWRSILIYGVSLGCMNLTFYLALARIPLGIAVALEFSGPLAVAIFSSRRALDYVWAALAVAGLLMLMPVTRQAQPLDPLGVAFALFAGVCWALYIIFGQKAGGDGGVRTTAIGMIIAAFVVIPFGVAQAGAALLEPRMLALGLVVGLLSTALPYSFEMFALTRIPTRTFGILMSLEPAVGAVAGFVVLGQKLSLIQILAVGAIVAASAGAAATARRAIATPGGD